LVEDIFQDIEQSDNEATRNIVKETGFNPLVIPILIDDLMRNIANHKMSREQLAVMNFIHEKLTTPGH
jgi:hypothetical protein